MNTIGEHELGPQGWAIDWFHGGVQEPGPLGRYMDMGSMFLIRPCYQFSFVPVVGTL